MFSVRVRGMPGERILIVDDNPQSLKLAQIVLSDEGYEIQTAGDAERALDLIAAFEPAAVLVDIRLPGMDGLELTRRLRRDARYKRMIILAVSAHRKEQAEAGALAAGCDGFISKPINLDVLVQTLAAHLARVRAG